MLRKCGKESVGEGKAGKNAKTTPDAGGKTTGKNCLEFLIAWHDFPLLFNYFVISYFLC